MCSGPLKIQREDDFHPKDTLLTLATLLGTPWWYLIMVHIEKTNQNQHG